MDTTDLARLQGRRVIAGHTSRESQVVGLQKPAEYHRAALEKIRQGGIATKVRILVAHDCCPACRMAEGAYEFDGVPELPVEGCSHPMGCRCTYAPILDLFGP